MRSLALVLVAWAFVPVAISAEPREVIEPYVVGSGDAGCIVSGFGCVRLFADGVESSVRLRAIDATGLRIAMDVCSPDCEGPVAMSVCGEGTVAGLTPGALIVVFLRAATPHLSCGLFGTGPATSGTLSATFT